MTVFQVILTYDIVLLLHTKTFAFIQAVSKLDYYVNPYPVHSMKFNHLVASWQHKISAFRLSAIFVLETLHSCIYSSVYSLLIFNYLLCITLFYYFAIDDTIQNIKQGKYIFM